MGTFLDFISFLVNRRNEIYEQTVEHIGLTLIALAIAVLIGLPVGIILTRYKKIAGSVLGMIGIIQTIPSIALLGFLLPILGIGATPAIVALFLYALLPIVRNTFTGINEIDASIKEAARGMGMSDLQILSKVEIPLAVPVIFAGIRTATVINVGVATLCALIAAGGLGEYIFRGIALNNVKMILAGAMPAAILALAFDFILSVIQRYIRFIIKQVLIFFGFVFAFTVFFYVVIPSVISQDFKAGFTAEFMERPDGYTCLRQRYGFSLKTLELDPGLMYKALKEKKVDVISGFSTDGRIEAYRLKVLEDDKQYFPPYYAAPLVRGETLRRYPVLREVFAEIGGKISDEVMRELNFQVDYNEKRPAEVAKDFLEQTGFNVSERREGGADIIIGSKNFTEQFILSEIFALLIENYTNLDVDLKTGLAGTKICFDALVSGEIDIYPEYTGTGLQVILKADEATRKSLMGNEDRVFEYVKKESKRRYDVEWLQPLGFNNTYALIMREEHAERLGIKSISDLKAYIDTHKLHIK